MPTATGLEMSENIVPQQRLTSNDNPAYELTEQNIANDTASGIADTQDDSDESSLTDGGSSSVLESFQATQQGEIPIPAVRSRRSLPQTPDESNKDRTTRVLLNGTPMANEDGSQNHSFGNNINVNINVNGDKPGQAQIDTAGNSVQAPLTANPGGAAVVQNIMPAVQVAGNPVACGGSDQVYMANPTSPDAHVVRHSGNTFYLPQTSQARSRGPLQAAHSQSLNSRQCQSTLQHQEINSPIPQPIPPTPTRAHQPEAQIVPETSPPPYTSQANHEVYYSPVYMENPQYDCTYSQNQPLVHTAINNAHGDPSNISAAPRLHTVTAGHINHAHANNIYGDCKEVKNQMQSHRSTRIIYAKAPTTHQTVMPAYNLNQISCKPRYAINTPLNPLRYACSMENLVEQPASTPDQQHRMSQLKQSSSCGCLNQLGVQESDDYTVFYVNYTE